MTVQTEIVNLTTATTSLLNEVITKKSVLDAAEGKATAVLDATKVSEAAAKGSEIAAKTSENNAKTQADRAKTEAAAAAASAPTWRSPTPFSWSGNTTRHPPPSRRGETRWRRSSCATRWPVGRKSDRPSRAHHGERGRRAAATSQVSLASWRCQR